MLKSFYLPIVLTVLLQIAFCQTVRAVYLCALDRNYDAAERSTISAETQSLQTLPNPKLPEHPYEGSVEIDATDKDDALVIIDKDENNKSAENKSAENEAKWQENIGANGKSFIDAGSKFPICMSSSHTSKTAKVGEPVEATLGANIKIGNRLFAARGSKINGHIVTCRPARKLMQANVSRKSWMRAGGSLGLQFDEIITPEGEHLALLATPACQARIVENKAEGRVLGVNTNGEITPPLSAQIKAKSVQTTIQLLGMLGGPFTMPAMPVAMGVMGAVSPSAAYMHPVGTNVRHRRLKGFAMGAIAGLPAGFLLTDTIIRAPESIINSGDQFSLELKEPLEIQTASKQIPLASAAQ